MIDFLNILILIWAIGAPVYLLIKLWSLTKVIDGLEDLFRLQNDVLRDDISNHRKSFDNWVEILNKKHDDVPRFVQQCIDIYMEKKCPDANKQDFVSLVNNISEKYYCEKYDALEKHLRITLNEKYDFLRAELESLIMNFLKEWKENYVINNNEKR